MPSTITSTKRWHTSIGAIANVCVTPQPMVTDPPGETVPPAFATVWIV